MDVNQLFQDEVKAMRSMGRTWTFIGKQFNIERNALWRWRNAVGFVDPMRDATDQELLDHGRIYLLENGKRGETFFAGYLLSKGFRVSRVRMRFATALVDGGAVQERTEDHIRRRVYSNPGPHYLWHADGNHKLIHWGIVLHGCIDGFSRHMIYCHYADNNKGKLKIELLRVLR